MITLERDWARALGVRTSVAAVVFDRRGRVLLQQRSDGGQWGLPGGSVEVGESAAQALRREVREETGLRVSVGRLIGVYSEPSRQVIRYSNGLVWHYVTLCFQCAVRGGRLATSAETLALGYFAPTRLPRPFLSHHVIRIRDARARRVAAVVR